MAAGSQTQKHLAEMPEKEILTETALAAALGVTTRTIRRMVGRCEIPPGTRLGGHTVWFAGRVLAYIDKRLEKAEQSAARRDAALGRHKGSRSA